MIGFTRAGSFGRQNSIESGIEHNGIASFAFPYNDNTPPRTGQLPGFNSISKNVTIEFVRPEIGVSLRHGRFRAAFMSMPETTVHEYGHTVFWQHDVRSTGEIWRMKLEPIAPKPNSPANDQFGLRVFLTDSAHEPASSQGIHRVRHRMPISGSTTRSAI